MLEMEGFVESKVNYRVRVAEFSVSDLEETYASRLVLESLALSRRLPRLTVAELNQMESELTKMRSAAAVREYERFATSHDLFHSFLITGVGSRLGQQIASELLPESWTDKSILTYGEQFVFGGAPVLIQCDVAAAGFSASV